MSPFSDANFEIWIESIATEVGQDARLTFEPTFSSAAWYGLRRCANPADKLSRAGCDVIDIVVVDEA